MQHLITIAPMMGYTDRHFRYMLRLITRHSLLYTEMITAKALLHGDKNRLLAYHPCEHPLALQVGGSDPMALQYCASIAEDLGFDEINLNAGCPSHRVQSGQFGICLLKKPDLVAECVAAMQARVSIPVTVKTRIGIDDDQDYRDIYRFIAKVGASGCKTFIIHARNAWLKGLSPKENRNIPPLRHDIVYKLKEDFADLTIIINGGISNLQQAKDNLTKVDGVMLGRTAYHNPYQLIAADKIFYKDTTSQLLRSEIVANLIEYAAYELTAGTKLTQITRHWHGLFYGEEGARSWRNKLSSSRSLAELASSY